MAQVVLEHVWKIYPGNVAAVQDFNLEVADREFMVFVGPSGCGKSTTLRMIAGLEEISRGAIRIGRRVVNDVPPKDRNIAMVFQNYALYPHMSVYDNMAFGLKLRKFKRAEIDARVRDAAEILGLTDYLKRRPKELSGGQRQRVAVGRAIVRKPDVFLFDEPLSNLDAKMRVQMRTEIGKLHKRLATTMIYVTHDQVEAMTMGDRIVVMKDGVVQQVAGPLPLYDHPANKFVAGFIGTPPMNFFDGRISAGAPPAFAAGDIRIPLPEVCRASLAHHVGREICLGLRPEDIGSPAAESDPALPRIRARVEVVEPMGAETYLYLKNGDHAFVSRTDAHRVCRAGDEIQVAVFMPNMRFFDPQSGLAV